MNPKKRGAVLLIDLWNIHCQYLDMMGDDALQPSRLLQAIKETVIDQVGHIVYGVVFVDYYNWLEHGRENFDRVADLEHLQIFHCPRRLNSEDGKESVDFKLINLADLFSQRLLGDWTMVICALDIDYSDLLGMAKANGHPTAVLLPERCGYNSLTKVADKTLTINLNFKSKEIPTILPETRNGDQPVEQVAKWIPLLKQENRNDILEQLKQHDPGEVAKAIGWIRQLYITRRRSSYDSNFRITLGQMIGQDDFYSDQLTYFASAMADCDALRQKKRLRENGSHIFNYRLVIGHPFVRWTLSEQGQDYYDEHSS
ncbi:MAG: hypothetical protein V1695_03040 [Candidatus Uhrbacteria bacterium]